MSLVGPRPELPELVEHYERDFPGYRARHAMRPGHHRLGAGQRASRQREALDRRSPALRPPLPARLELGARRADPRSAPLRPSSATRSARSASDRADASRSRSTRRTSELAVQGTVARARARVRPRRRRPGGAPPRAKPGLRPLRFRFHGHRAPRLRHRPRSRDSGRRAPWRAHTTNRAAGRPRRPRPPGPRRVAVRRRGRRRRRLRRRDRTSALAIALLGVAALVNAFVDHFAAVLRGRDRFADEARLNTTRAAHDVGRRRRRRARSADRS